jgi:hypothetical protein
MIVWDRDVGWRNWLINELSYCGWSHEDAQLVVDHVHLNVKVVEVGVRPRDKTMLPKDFCLETEWGVLLCRDNSPEKSVLELKLSIPRMQSYLGIPEIMKWLKAIEQGFLTVARRQRVIEALLYALCRLLRRQGSIQD